MLQKAANAICFVAGETALISPSPTRTRRSRARRHISIALALFATFVVPNGSSQTSGTSTDKGRSSGGAIGDDRAIFTSDRALKGLAREVRHELLMLPYYGVFDNLAFRIEGSTVTLLGHVTRPTLQSGAENVVKRIEGVERVNNQIEVLPVSPNDDRLRIAVANEIYGFPALSLYAWGAVPPIHIIVRNGNVTLEGVVATEADKNMAGVRANGVSGVFGVTNNLRVEQQEDGNEGKK